MICWRCHSNSVNTGSHLPRCSDVKTRKRRNMVGIDMIRNKRIRNYFRNGTRIMLFQLKKLPEIINLTRFLKSFWILYIDQIIVYNTFYSKLTFYIIKYRCQMHALKFSVRQCGYCYTNYPRHTTVIFAICDVAIVYR
jgi:hypothetical protein